MRMKPLIKDKWLKALRSGEYKQGRQNLHLVISPENQQFCCLGVLCDLAVQEGVVDRWNYASEVMQYGERQGLSSHTTLPRRVWEWAGLDTNSPVVLLRAGNKRTSLATLNDQTNDQWDFNRIAQIIEEQL